MVIALIGERLMLDIDEVAEQLKVSVSTIRTLVRTGKLRAYRIGGRQLRFRQEDIDSYVDSVVVRPGEEIEEHKEESEDQQ